MKFREYQVKIIKNAVSVLNRYKFVYLSMQVRTGKTLTAMGVAQKLKIKRMLFVTKKKLEGEIFFLGKSHFEKKFISKKLLGKLIFLY